MSVIPGTGCCCDDPAEFSCPARQICVEGNTKNWWDLVRAEYITVGRPKGPTVFPGTYWAAWHNGMHPLSSLDVDLTIDVIKRTVVQESCGSACPSVSVPTGNNCATTGFLTATAGCKQTAYTDNFNWNMTGNLRLIGVLPDNEQEWRISSDPYHLQYFVDVQDSSAPTPPDAGRPYPSILPGPLPCGISGTCSTCADPNEVTDFGTDPTWWAGENRKLIPRFFSKGVTVDTTSVPSDDYPQNASCGSVLYVNRCNTVETESTSECCLDFPIIVLPSHEGTLCNGLASAPCDVLNKENGADQALWGFDLLEPKLIERFNNMALPDGVYMGASNDIWLVKWTNQLSVTKIRILFDVSRKILSPGETLKFTTDILLNETGTITRVDALESWRMSLDLSFTPRGWCVHAPECGCIQSYSENAPSVINYTMMVHLDTRCSGTPSVTFDISIGLEDVRLPDPFQFYEAENLHGFCPCGVGCDCNDPNSPFQGSAAWCFQWDELPEGGLADPDGETKKYHRFLGDAPIERGHPLWRRYRNKYNHSATTVDWFYNGQRYYFDCYGGYTRQFVAYGSPVQAGEIYVEATPVMHGGFCCGGALEAAGVEAAPPFAEPCGSITANYDPTCNGGNGGFVCLPEGCYDVEPSVEQNGSEHVISLLNCDCSPQLCNPYQSCSYQMFSLCGGTNVTVCDIAGLTSSTGLPEIVVVPWDPTQSCDPRGVLTEAFVTSVSTVCEGPSAWSKSNISVWIT